MYLRAYYVCPAVPQRLVQSIGLPVTAVAWFVLTVQYQSSFSTHIVSSEESICIKTNDSVLADRTDDHAYATVLHPSVRLSVLCS